TPDGKRLAAGTGSTIRLWDLDGPSAKLAASASVDDPAAYWAELTFSADGKTLYSASDGSAAVRIWSVGPDSLKPRADLRHPEMVDCNGLAPGGTRLAGDVRDRKANVDQVGLWKLEGEKLELLARLGPEERNVVGTVFSPDGSRLLGIPLGDGKEWTVRVW